MKLLLLITVLFFWSCQGKSREAKVAASSGIELLVLGTVQDGGSPHPGCDKACCTRLFEDPANARKVSCLGIVDHDLKQTFLFDATPDLPSQMKILKNRVNAELETPDAIFLSHAHIGHYSGLMYLGREAMAANDVLVYGMPRMSRFLKENGPWDQLVRLENIHIAEVPRSRSVRLNKRLTVELLEVPHRDEYSETVGFVIRGPLKNVLFIPDIDKWDLWSRSIDSLVQRVDYAFIDGTFFDVDELPGRNMDEIPHPFIVESMERLQGLSEKDKSKVHFIHFNHTNPVLDESSEETWMVRSKGFKLARTDLVFTL